MITEGQTAPDFTLPRDGGGNVTLSAFRPHPVVVYFYPRADTPVVLSAGLCRCAQIASAGTVGHSSAGPMLRCSRLRAYPC